MVIAQILEAAMLIAFGLSWPLNAYKTWKAGTATGKSWQFILLITLGYVAGIGAKFAADAVNWVLVVYFLNLASLSVNWFVYFRNRRLDAERKQASVPQASPVCSVERVLIATDGSAASLDAISFASHTIDLARAGKIELLSVAETPAGRKRAEDALTEAEELLASRDIATSSRIREGDAAAAIVSEVNETNAGILVMGSRGLSGIKELLLGSVSKAVSEKVTCPVLIVK